MLGTTDERLTLESCLARCTYDRLRRMGQFLQVGLKDPERHRKAAWVGAIRGCWAKPHNQRAIWHQLSPAAQHLAVRLCRANTLPTGLLLAEGGGLRPHKEQTRPWTPVEELYLAGLLFGRTGADPRRAARVALPDDLVGPILALAGEAQQLDGTPLDPMLDGMPNVVHDVAQLLILRCLLPEMTLLHGRWLPATALAVLARRVDQLHNHVPSRTHKQTVYLRDLMFWAVAAELIVDGQLTAKAWAWLAREPAACLRELWRGWLGSADQTDSDLRSIFLQGDALWSEPLRRRCVAYLQTFAGAFDVLDLANKLLGDVQIPAAYFAAHFESLAEFDASVAAVLSTTLRYLGVVTQLPDGKMYRLTATGHWLMQPDAALHPNWTWTSDARVRPDDGAAVAVESAAITVDVARMTVPHGQAQLALFAMDAPRPSAHPHSYRLTEATVAAAAARGHGLPLLLEGLATLGVSLTPTQVAVCRRWWQRGHEVQIALLPVIRTQRKEQLAAIVQSSQLRSVIGEVLAPTLATWQGDPTAVMTALRAAGFYPGSHLSDDEANSTLPDSAALWLAGQLYQLLGEHLPLPLPLSTNKLDALLAELTPVQQAALTEHMQTLRRRLLDLLDSLPYLPPPQPSDPALWLPLLEQAIEDEAILTMVYYSAGRNLTTRRRIQPLWRETHRDVDYVRAQCIDTGTVLTFRLDRILELR